MRCYKCGAEADLKNGLCSKCYKEITEKRNIRKKRTNSFSIFSNLKNDEKIIYRTQNSTLIFAFIFSLLAIAVILFPRTILEFFFRNNKTFFLILIANIFLFFSGIYLSLYFFSREIILTNKNIIAKWGIFKIKIVTIPLNKIEYIDTFKIRALEIDIPNKIYVFDYIANAEKFKLSTITQIKNIIRTTTDENILMSFSHSLNETLEKYELEERFPNMAYCPCCKQVISKNSEFCVHCGNPIYENERCADLFLKLICFLIPPFGIIIFLIHIGRYPKLSKQCILSSIFSIFILITLYLSYIFLIK